MTSAAFAFVGELAASVNSGKLDLPSWPAAITQIRQALEDENSNVADIVRLIGSEPVLVARIMTMANSASLGRNKPVTDLKTATNRLGFKMVRNLVTSLAMTQIFDNETGKEIKSQLEALWMHSSTVAAISHLLAKRNQTINPDEAFLAGLVHDIGKLYVYTRAQGNANLFDTPESVEEIAATWHTSIGRAIVESWGFSGDVAEAVSNHENYQEEEEVDGPATLTDVVTIANLLANHAQDDSGSPVDLDALPATGRLGLDSGDFEEIVLEADYEIQAMGTH